MKNTNPILLFRNVVFEYPESKSAIYNYASGLHNRTPGNDSGDIRPEFTNSMQTKTREAIDTVENSEN
jgi:hypothetical protein